MNKFAWAACALILSAHAPALAHTAPAANQAALPAADRGLFTAQDLFGMEVASDAQISPDGSRIAYVRQTADIMTDQMRPTIWLIDVKTGQHSPLVASAGSHRQPRWSPDGTRLSYISNAEGGAPQLFVRWMASGEAVRVTNLPNTPSSISWSPNGEQLAYSVLVPGDKPKIGSPLPKPEGAKWAPPLEIIDTVSYRSDGQGYLKPGFRHVFVVGAQGGGARQLTHGDFHHGGGLSWSADSRTLYLSANRRPDWQREAAESEVFALDVQTGGLTALTSRAGPDNSPVASPDGRRIAYLGYDDKGMGYHNTRLYVMDADGSNNRVLTPNLDRSVKSPVWSRDGRSVYVAYDDQGRIQVASSHDQRAVESWLTLPADYVEGQRYPLVLEIHGGPFAAYGPHFATDNQLFAAAGYAVLSVNPRGSTSYGDEFANLIHHNYPSNDYDDLISSVDAIIAQGIADPNRLFVTGGSGGGVLTSWIVGKTDRFKAAVVQKPVIDWASFVLTADNPAFFARYWFGEYPWENPEAYWRRSPLSLVGNVKTPTMVVVGDEDYRTPVSESEQYYTALQLRGVPTALVKIPGVGHSLAVRPSQNAARMNAMIEWFERYKDGAPTAR